MKAIEQAGTAVGRRALLASVVMAVAAGCAPRALADSGPVDLTVVDRETGRELPVWRHRGRAYVAGEPGARYGLRLANHTGGRVLLVLSVDGVNVLTGETAAYGQRGYVLNPYEAYDINGWRKSDSEIAAFAFAAQSRSYAARTGRPGDVGVIGMAVFTERTPDPVVYDAAPSRPWVERRSRSDDAPPPLPLPPVKAPMPEASALPPPPPPPPAAMQAPSAAFGRSAIAPRLEEKLGTEHGAREWSVATRTTFVRATSYPQSVRRIEYDTYANLAAAGVIPSPRYGERRPRPFPEEPDRSGFVPDPPGR